MDWGWEGWGLWDRDGLLVLGWEDGAGGCSEWKGLEGEEEEDVEELHDAGWMEESEL